MGMAILTAEVVIRHFSIRPDPLSVKGLFLCELKINGRINNNEEEQ
jgi:hypothetical protein